MKAVGLAIVAVMLLGVNAEAKRNTKKAQLKAQKYQETTIENLK